MSRKSGKPIDLGLSPEQMSLIGAYSAHWSFLESEIEFTLSCLGEHVDQDQTVPFPFDDKLKRWRKLSKQVYPEGELRDRCEAIITTAKSAQKIRSILLHGRIEGDPSRKRKTVFVEHHRHRQHGWEVQPYNIPIKMIRHWVRQLGVLSATLIEFNEKTLPGTPASLPRKFGQQRQRSARRQGSIVLMRKPLPPTSGG